MDIPFNGALTAEDTIKQAKLANRPSRTKSTVFIDQWVLTLMSGLILLALSLWRVFAGELWLLVVSVLGLINIALGLRMRDFPSAAWRDASYMREHMEGRATDQGIEIRTRFASAKYPWSEFTGLGRYGDDLIVFFQGPMLLVTLARSFFSTQEDWQAIRLHAAKLLPLTHEATPAINPIRRLRISRRQAIFIAILVVIVLVLILARPR